MIGKPISGTTPGLCAWVAGLAAVLLLADARAAEFSFTVGIDTRCPYGLVVCWAEVREPIEQLEGLKSVSERADAKTLTCEIQMKDGLLPDLKALKRHLREGVGELFWIRGVEATLDGVLVSDSGKPALQVEGTKHKLRLVPLKDKVQADPKTKSRVAPSDGERDAHSRLTAEWKGQPARVRVVGPLVESEGNATPVLEVREFTWLKENDATR